MRALWSKLVQAVQNAIQYTYLNEPSQEEYGKVLIELSIVIDELRGVYRNIGERTGYIGLYPYEPIKGIYEAIAQLGYGKLEEEKRTTARTIMTGHWKSMRGNFLDEFDRAEPTKVVSPYVAK